MFSFRLVWLVAMTQLVMPITAPAREAVIAPSTPQPPAGPSSPAALAEPAYNGVPLDQASRKKLL